MNRLVQPLKPEKLLVGREWKAHVLLVCIGGLLLAGCQDTTESDRMVKLEQVRSAALRHVSAEDRDVFREATLVSGLKDLPTPGCGLRVPIQGSPKAVFVLFEVDYFDENSVDKLAAEAVADYARSKPSLECGDLSPHSDP